MKNFEEDVFIAGELMAVLMTRNFCKLPVSLYFIVTTEDDKL